MRTPTKILGHVNRATWCAFQVGQHLTLRERSMDRARSSTDIARKTYVELARHHNSVVVRYLRQL